jgi:hypothetical protein
MPAPDPADQASGGSAEEYSDVDFEIMARQLRAYSLELRSTGKEMRKAARAPLPRELNEYEKTRLKGKYRELEAAADNAQELAVQVQRRAWKARHQTLTPNDIDSLLIETALLAKQIVLKIPQDPNENRTEGAAPSTKRAMTAESPSPSTQDEMKRLDIEALSETIREIESMQESVRNEQQMAETAFQNFDQKANQLYNLLSSVMKAMNEMRMGTVRNTL